MIRVGIIQIGLSKIKLMLAEVEDVGYFKVIDQLKTPFKVSHELSNDCILSADNMDFILSTLNTYKSLCEASGAKEIFTFTTSFISCLKGCESITSFIKLNLGLELKILTPEEEIHYTALGVKRSMNLSNSLIVEINGISTTLIDIKDGEVNNWTILPIGGINTAYSYEMTDRVLSPNLIECSYHIKEKLFEIPWLNDSYDSIVFIGDLAKTVVKIDKYRTHYPLEMFNNYELSTVSINELYNLFKCKDLKLRKKIEGVDLDIIDSIFTSLLIFKEITSIVKPEVIRTSINSIREGLLYKYLYDNYEVIDNSLDYSICGILNSLNADVDHAKHVFFLSSMLFNQLKPLHRLNDNYLKILKTGSMLHDSGISINYDNHHKHSFYVILNSVINDLTHKEHLMGAAVAAYHRFNSFHLPLAQFSYLLNKLDIDSIAKLGALVKIAEGLDRSLVGVVKKLNVEFDEETVTITVSSPNNLDVEIHQALRAKYFFKKVYNRDLYIEKEEWQN